MTDPQFSCSQCGRPADRPVCQGCVRPLVKYLKDKAKREYEDSNLIRGVAKEFVDRSK